MASNEDNTPAWMAAQEQIDRFFDRVEKRRASAAFIQGPHACGKSTTMLAHLFAQAQDKAPGAPVVYILPSPVEVAMLLPYLTSEDFNEQLSVPIADSIITEPAEDYSVPAGKLLITDYKQFLNLFLKLNKFPLGDRAVVAIDLQTNPTCEGEILLGRILEWVSSCHESKDPAAAVVAISPFASPRTEGILHRVGRKPDVIRIPAGPDPPIQLTPLGKSWKEDVEKMASLNTAPMSPEDPRTMFGVVSMQDLFFRNQVETLDMDLAPETVSDYLSHERCLLVKNNLEFSLPWKGLRDFVSERTIRELGFDPQHNIVMRTRVKTKVEILREQSWLLKSNVPRKDVVFYTTSTLDYQNLPDHEPCGTAYTAGISWTLLHFIEQWPSKTITSMPVRRVPNAEATVKIITRLLTLGCAVPSGLGSRVTAKGTEMLHLMNRIESLDNFQVAFFLASARPRAEQLRPNVMRVIVRLAALLQVGIGNICRKVENASPPSLDEVRQMCRGVGASLVHRGALWIALGLWQEKVHTGQTALLAFITDGAFRMLYPTPWLILNPAAMYEVQGIVSALETFLQITPFTDGEELSATELTDEEVIFIERELLSAYRYNIVALPRDTRSRPFDAGSFLNLNVSKRDILNVEEAREGYRGEADRCFAIYSGLAVRGKDYFAEDVTLLPDSLLEDVRAYTGAGITGSQ
ncbi:hypothetical protein F4815DRAFT_494761 [Daldinia loculata]|nr:hypothetical protein F4815DRAFT_494761 [Daldinia loculata]